MNMKPNNTSAAPLLVIEDEPSVIAFIQAALERSGYKVAPVSSGVEALRMLQEGQFLGVVSDMRTPGGVNGADVHATPDCLESYARWYSCCSP